MRLLYFLRGYVRIIISGPFLERFINICMHRGIFMWDIKTISSGKTELKMSMRAFRRLPPIARKTRTRVKIIEKSGLPYTAIRIKKRRLFTVGLLIFVSFMYISSFFIWSVEVDGNSVLSDEQILSALASLGCKKGALKHRIDQLEIKNRALLLLDDINWIWVDIKGCRAYVSVLEKKKAPEIVNTDCCDIIAKKSGVIYDVIATGGTAKVLEGDTVQAGDILISSQVESERIPTRYTHAAGEVYARVWYEESVRQPMQKEKKVSTGNKKNRISFVIGEKTVSPLGKTSPFQNSLKKTKANLISPFKFKIGFLVDTYEEYNIEYEPISAEEAAEAAKKYLCEKIDKMSGGTLNDENFSFAETTDGAVFATLTREYVEQIGEVKYINVPDSAEAENAQ